MNKKRYSNEETAWIMGAWASTYESVEEFCQEHGLHPQTNYGWNQTFEGMSGDGAPHQGNG